jgi:predicted CXXCH cytochrome family protein
VPIVVGGSRWRKPCWQGPDAKGSCGGEAQCVPLRRGDRYYCQRPDHAGGPCQEGPFPYGKCANVQPPCRPRISLRRLRGRITLIGVLLLIALITIFSNRDSGSTMTAMINPGELSSSHSGFPVSDRCENCHAAHDKDTADWLMSVFEHQDLSAQCVQCHKLPGPDKAAHNRVFDNAKDDIVVECKSCHQEHKGSEFNISRVSDQICSNCHEQQFSQLSDHVKFSATFPHQEPQGIYFDHATHLGEYFVEETWLEKKDRDADFAKQASAACSTCHQIENAARNVPIRDYETICASCHEHQISDRLLTLLTPDEAYPALLGLLTASGEEPEDSEEAALALIETLSSDGIDAMTDIIEEAGTEIALQRALFSGLNSSELTNAAKAWAEEESIEIAAEEIVGWKAGENNDGSEAIIYKPSGHADPTLMLWIETYLARLATDESELNEEVVSELLDMSEGPGGCGKCHGTVIGDSMQSGKALQWGKSEPTVREHTSGFSHLPHIDLLGATAGCDACHQPNNEAEYSAFFEDKGKDPELFQSRFFGISLDTCTNCHNENRVSANCQLCHSYHRDVSFQHEYQIKEKERLKP